MNEITTERRIVSTDPQRYAVRRDGSGTLVATHCATCGERVFGSFRACLGCASPEVTVTEAARTGRLLNFTVVHRAPAGWWGGVPYVLGEVETDDGVVVTAGMVDAANGVVVGMPVELRDVVVEHPTEEARVGVFQWAPRPGSGSGV